MATSSHIFLNDNFLPLGYMKLSDKTKVVQLWHGMGSFKKFGGSSETNPEVLKELKAATKNTDHILASSENIRDNYAEAFIAPKEKVICIGCPQVDYFFREHDIAAWKEELSERYPEMKGKKLVLYAPTFRGEEEHDKKLLEAFDFDAFQKELGEDYWSQLMDEIELLDGASADFDMELVTKGELSPVFFGSALTNFGVETFLQHFLKMTYAPTARQSDIGMIDPFSEDFSAFVFKIQANMNKNHRDRIAFMRICSGQFTAGMEVYHVQGGKSLKLSQPQQMMADERKIVDKAYAGDIIGVFDPGVYSIGDTLTTAKDKFEFEGIPTFAPEHFARVSLVDSMKRKQFVKGVTQIAQEGAIQMFQEYKGGMEEIIVGVVGVLQFDVLKFRLENEYNVQIRLENLPYEHIRWIENKDEVNVDTINGTSDMKKVVDMKGNPLLLFINEWSIGMTLDRNDGLVLTEFGRN